MREKTFRVPKTREIIEMNGLVYPTKLNGDYILGMIADGNFVMAGNSFKEAVRNLESIHDKSNAIMIFPPRFSVDRETFNKMSKSLEWMVKIDSQSVLREVSGNENVPKTMTKEFLEHYKIKPEKLIKSAVSLTNSENPPVGYYWMGWDRKPRTVHWVQSATAAEMIVMHKQGAFEVGDVKDKKPYARNMRVSVSSRSEEGKHYDFSIFRMPIFSNDKDSRIYSYWVNIDHSSSDPFANYMAEHEQQVLPQCSWSTTAITGVYLSMMHLNKIKHPLQFKVNPFSIPSDKSAIDFIDDARLKSLILAKDLDGKLSLRPLNKSEINRLLGARTSERGYDSCWFNMGKNRLDYLYEPKI